AHTHRSARCGWPQGRRCPRLPAHLPVAVVAPANQHRNQRGADGASSERRGEGLRPLAPGAREGRCAWQAGAVGRADHHAGARQRGEVRWRVMSRRKGDKNKKPLTSRRLRYEYLRLTRLYDDIGPRASAANLKTERSRAKKEGIAEARRIVAEA